MSSQKYIAVILAISMTVFILAFLLNFGIASFGALENSINASESPYQEQMNLTTDVTKASFSLLQFTPLLLSVALIVFALFAFVIIIQKRGRW